MKPKIKNGEGILLRVRKAGEGGRSLFLFSRTEGVRRAFVPHSALRRCGSGLLFPFSHILYTLTENNGAAILSQYEGELLFSFEQLGYEDICCWYYAVEIVLRFFPEGEADAEAYELLMAAGRAGKRRNLRLTAFILAVKLLTLAGYDPAEEEPLSAAGLSPEARLLIRAFRTYRWEENLPVRVKRPAFREAGAYLDRFVLEYAETELVTRGAFLQV